MSIIPLLTILIFLTLFFSIYFELLYFNSKRNYLAQISNKDIKHDRLLKRLAEKLNWDKGVILAKIFNYQHISNLLHKSGQPFNLTIKNFITLHRLLGDLALLILSLLFIVSGKIFPDIIIYPLLWIVIAYLPILWLKTLIAKRNKKFNYSLSTFIDMLSLSVNAGMNFENALFFTTKKFNGVIHEEFQHVIYEISYGKSLEEALSSLSKKIDSIDLKRFVTAVKQSKKLGTPMSKTLAIQSKLILTSRIQKAEELSRTASVKISIPLVFFIFPALLILYLVPAILQFIK